MGACPPLRGRQGRLCRARGTEDDRTEEETGRRIVTKDKSDQPASQPVRQANQRGAARLAAVQALYQMDISGAGVLEIVAEFEAHRLGQEIDGETYLKADPAWFRSIVSGVVRDQRKLDPLIGGALQDDWALSRLDATVRAILRAGVFEIIERKDVPVAVIVTEYVEIAKAFFEDDEPKLVNAVLDRIAKQVRTERKA
nr:transcription antitermination factor NusB [Mycoplana azooxidifex]